jgi:Protein of unknown function (DUF2849)
MPMAASVPQMLTANRLKDGDVLYWKVGAWVEALKDGEVFAESAPAEAALAAAQSFVAGNVVVNPYLFDVRVDGNDIHPVKEREIIRAAGPSVRSDLGKQAFHPPSRGGWRRHHGLVRCIDMTSSMRALSPSAWRSFADRSRGGYRAN